MTQDEESKGSGGSGLVVFGVWFFTSLFAFGGLGAALLDRGLDRPAILVIAVAGVLAATAVGLSLGRRLGKTFGSRIGRGLGVAVLLQVGMGIGGLVFFGRGAEEFGRAIGILFRAEIPPAIPTVQADQAPVEASSSPGPAPDPGLPPAAHTASGVVGAALRQAESKGALARLLGERYLADPLQVLTLTGERRGDVLRCEVVIHPAKQKDQAPAFYELRTGFELDLQGRVHRVWYEPWLPASIQGVVVKGQLTERVRDRTAERTRSLAWEPNALPQYFVYFFLPLLQDQGLPAQHAFLLHRDVARRPDVAPVGDPYLLKCEPTGGAWTLTATAEGRAAATDAVAVVKPDGTLEKVTIGRRVFWAASKAEADSRRVSREK